VENEFEISKYERDKNPHAHFHETYEILIPLSNEGTFFVQENGYQLCFGTIFILHEYVIHRCFCSGNKSYARYAIHFPRRILEEMSTSRTNLSALFENAPLVLRVQDDALANLLGILCNLTKPNSDDFGNDIERALSFRKFLLMLAKIIAQEEPLPPPLPKSDPRVDKVLQYIHANYSCPISLETLSKEFYISKSRLSQQFRKSTGFSIGDYIITYRIRRACVLLRQGMKIQNISKAVGFQNDTHFIRTFKKRMGMCPSDFEKQVLAGSSPNILF
jgi:AraC-like DNA-binding protein